MTIEPLSDLDSDALVSRFSACALPRAARTHRAHLTVGCWHVTLLQQFLDDCSHDMPLDACVTLLLDSPLADKDLLLPDLVPLRVEAVLGGRLREGSVR